ncbi:MAG: hypothetical protein IJ737_07450 [Ruminococcus sp.]|nr:hypothetical protein [Ruminococcus sp.]
MRKCLRCGNEMTEGFKVGSNGLRITGGGTLGTPAAELKCAVCPECGYAELYAEDKDKIRRDKNA